MLSVDRGRVLPRRLARLAVEGLFVSLSPEIPEFEC